MRISDWSSDVCSSDLRRRPAAQVRPLGLRRPHPRGRGEHGRLGLAAHRRRGRQAGEAGSEGPMIRAFLSRRAEWPARVTDPGAPPRLGLLWREAAALFQAFGGRIRPLPPEPNPDSDHPPVMVLPGFLSGDWATRALRADLRRAGFRCSAWGLGFNRGATPDIIERIDGSVQWIIDRP